MEIDTISFYKFLEWARKTGKRAFHIVRNNRRTHMPNYRPSTVQRLSKNDESGIIAEIGIYGGLIGASQRFLTALSRKLALCNLTKEVSIQEALKKVLEKQTILDKSMIKQILHFAKGISAMAKLNVESLIKSVPDDVLISFADDLLKKSPAAFKKMFESAMPNGWNFSMSDSDNLKIKLPSEVGLEGHSKEVQGMEDGFPTREEFFQWMKDHPENAKDYLDEEGFYHEEYLSFLNHEDYDYPDGEWMPFYRRVVTQANPKIVFQINLFLGGEILVGISSIEDAENDFGGDEESDDFFSFNQLDNVAKFIGRKYLEKDLEKFI